MDLPALAVQQVKVPDQSRTLMTAAYLKTSGIKNKLLESKLATENKRLGMLGKIVGSMDGGGGTPLPGGQGEAPLPGSGAQSGAPDMGMLKKYLVMFPEDGEKIVSGISKMDDMQRKQLSEKNKLTGQLLSSVLLAPPEQQPMIYARALERAGGLGLNVGGMPKTFDRNIVQQRMLQSMAVDDQIKYQEFNKPKKEDMIKRMTPKGPVWEPRYESPKTAKDGDGYLYYTAGPDKGKRVNPGAKSPNERFLEDIGSAPPTGGAGDDTLGLGDTAQGQPPVVDIAAPADSTIVGGTDSAKEPSFRDIFWALDPGIRAAIRVADNPREAFFKVMTRQKGWSVTTNKDGTVSITQGDQGPLGKAPTNKFQEEVVNNQQALDRIQNLETLYEQDFLTYKGSAKGSWATFMNKLNPNERSKFQARRAKFISAANRDFLTFRKWATGVAGGEKEMAEIKRATFSEDDSPQDFEAKLDAAKSMYRRLNARLRASLSAGIDPAKNEKAFREYIKANPLENIPTINDRGTQLEQLGYTKDKVVKILIDEGYINPRQAK